MRLTDKTIAGLVMPAGKTDRIWFDDVVVGFGYRLRTSGAAGRVLRSWITQYKRGGRNRRILIGSADVLTADQARAAARKLLARVALGEDPAGDRRDRRGRVAITLRSTVPEYLAATAPRLRAKSMYDIRRYLTGAAYFGPLQALPIDQIDRRAIAARLVVLERQHGAPTALKARAALSGFFTWAMKSGVADANPADQAPKPAASRSRERTLSDAELAAVWRAADDDDYGRIMRLLVLCGARRSEIGGMMWSELDFDAGVWILPAARSKNHKAHRLPIMPAMRAILDQVPRRATREYLFGANARAGFNSWDDGKKALDARSGVTGWTVHDLRRTAATRMADLGIAPHVVEEILNHQSGHRRGVAGTYNRSRYEREVHAALAILHYRIRVLAAGGERKVVPFAPG
jgi:integrase